MPVYNEAKIIRKNIEKVYNKLLEINKDFELFIIDDNSNDGSSLEIKPLLNVYKNLFFIYCENGPSKRENLAESFKKANGEIIIYIDSDLECELDNLYLLIKNIQDKNCDIVMGNRYLKESKTKRRLFRLIVSKLYNYTNIILFNFPITDTQCGFKSFKKEIILEIINDMGYDNTFDRGWFWDAEVIIRAYYKKFKIMEIPLEWNERKNRHFSLIENLKVIPFMIKLKRKL